MQEGNTGLIKVYQRQDIIERAHDCLKMQLQKIKTGEGGELYPQSLSEVQWLPEHLVWCVEQRNVSFDDAPPEELE